MYTWTIFRGFKIVTFAFVGVFFKRVAIAVDVEDLFKAMGKNSCKKTGMNVFLRGPILVHWWT